MRLIDCYINNFGKISDKSFEFSSGINSFCYDNGWGKTTLCTFIRVMLFGFKNENKRDALENERKKYKPWVKGLYGGKLTLEAEGKKYVIARTFGDKVSEDNCEIREYETNKLTDELGTNPGQVLFGIDADSFVRSAYVSQSECGYQITDGINAKLGNLADNTDDINNYEKVMKKLTDKINELTPNRKTGSLKRINETITKLKSEIGARAALESEYFELTERINAVKKQESEIKQSLAELGQKMDSENLLREKMSEKKEYEGLIKSKAEREKEVADIKAEFKGKEPEEKLLRNYLEDCTLLSKKKGELESYRLSKEEKEFFDKLGRDFAGQIPGEEEVEKITSNIGKINVLEKEISDCEVPYEDKKRLEQLDKYFSESVPTVEEIDKMLSIVSYKSDVMSSVSAKETNLKIMEQTYEEKCGEQHNGYVKRRSMLLILAGVTAAVGAALGFLISALLFSVLLLPVVFIICAVIPEKKPETDRLLIKTREDLEKDKASLIEADRQLEEFKNKYSWPYEDTQISYSLMDMKKAVAEYRTLKSMNGNKNADLLRNDRDSLRELVYDFLNKYRVVVPGNEISEGLHKFIDKRKDYIYLKNKFDKYASVEAEITLLDKKISEFLVSMGITEKDDSAYGKEITRMLGRLAVYNNTKEELNKVIRAKQEFEENNPDYEQLLMIQEDKETTPVSQINEERIQKDALLEEVRETLQNYNKKSEELSALLSQISEKEEELDRTRIQYASEYDSYNDYCKVRDYLSKAKEIMTNKYTGPIRDGFAGYYETVANTGSEDFHLDSSINVTKEEAGMQRNIGCLSRGQQDLVYLCMRLALVDAMYKEEKPFIVLDDPFTNLDSDKQSRGRQLLEEVAGKYQVIYFTCHESRK